MVTIAGRVGIIMTLVFLAGSCRVAPARPNPARDWLAGRLCRPPCFLNITPNQTSYGDAVRILAADPHVASLGTSPPAQIFWRAPELGFESGAVVFDHESGKAQYFLVRFTDRISIEDVITAYGPPSHVLACWHLGTDTPNVHYLLDVVWLNQGFALTWLPQVDVAPLLGPTLDQFDVVFFEPTLTGYGTHLYHPDALQALKSWKGMLSYSDYNSKCPLQP